MAKETNVIGIAMGLDVSDLKAGLAKANLMIKETNSEFEAAAAGLGEWSKKSEGLELKIKQLTTVLDLQTKKLKGLEAEYERVAAEQGESSVRATQLRIQINQQQKIVTTTTRELDNYKETLKDVKEGSIDLEEVTIKSGKAIKKAGDEAEESADGGFTVFKAAMADLVSNGIQNLISGLKGLYDSFASFIDDTVEYTSGLHQLEVAYGKIGMTVDETRESYKYFNSVLGDTRKAQEAMLLLAQLTDNQQGLTEWTDILTGAFATYGEALPLETLAESINHTAQMGKVEGIFADALEWAGKSVDDYNKKLATMSTKEERSAYIKETLLELYGESAEEYNKLNEDIREASYATADLEEAQAKLAEKLRPILTELKLGFAKVLESVVALLEDVDWEGFGDMIVSAFDNLIKDIIPAIVDAIQFVIDNKESILSWILAIGAGFLTWKIGKIIPPLITGLKGLATALYAAAKGQKALNAAMKANIIIFIISLIVGLISYLVTLWQTNEEFRNKVTKAWKDVSNTIKKFVEDIGKWFKDIGDKFIKVGNDIVKGIWDGIENGKDWLKTKITSFAGNVADWFKDTFQINSPSKLMADEVGLYLGEGVGEGILDSMPYVKKDLSKFSKYITDNLSGVKAGLSVNNGVMTGLSGNNGQTIINAGMSVSYNGSLSRKQIKRLEDDQYSKIVRRLKAQGGY